MAHNHSHLQPKNQTERNLFITVLLNILITIVEVTGGIISGSLSLLSDAVHNLSDGVSIIITYVAMRLSKRPRTLKYTFGLKRAEILAAIINTSTLISISFILIKEAIGRFNHPTEISGAVMLIVALAGLIANVLGTLLLKNGIENNMNLRATYYHLLSDAVSSLGVITGAVCIIYFRIYWIDPVLTIIISLYILKEAFAIVKEAMDVVMMTSPSTIDLSEVKSMIESIPKVQNIHHVHVWKLNDTDIHFEGHIEAGNILVAETTEIQNQIEKMLHDKYEIHHTTLQFECGKCTTKTII